MRKGDIVEGVIDHVDFPNKGYILTQEGPVIVKNGIPGQTVRAMVNKKKHGRVEARLLERLQPSPLETVQAVCGEFPDCGGCMYQTMDYGQQLQMKSRQVRQLLDEAMRQAGQVREDASPDYEFEGITASPDQWEYRNKMEFSFGDDHLGGPLTLGLHKKGSTYDVLTTADCRLVHPDFTLILTAVLQYFTDHPMPFYKKMKHEGYLRHLLLRRSQTSGEILVHIVTTSQGQCDMEPLVEELLSLQTRGKIAGIMHIINDSLADVVRSDQTRILYGRDYFYETILGLTFKISSFSFFQTNTRGAEELYRKARGYIGDIEDMTVFDLYCGTGTISQIMAGAARRVVGVEIVSEAVEAARENAALNGLDNCTFIAGDVLTALDEIEEKPDYIVLDPPRDGINPKALRKIIDYQVPHMVYISCKPTSLTRDLQLLIQGGYRLEKACCVDMFPNTVHVETVCLMSRVEGK